MAGLNYIPGPEDISMIVAFALSVSPYSTIGVRSNSRNKARAYSDATKKMDTIADFPCVGVILEPKLGPWIYTFWIHRGQRRGLGVA